jgi:hypothetical protein
MKSVFREAVDAVFLFMGKNLISDYVGRFFNGLKRKESVIKTLYCLGQAAAGVFVGFTA